jgi:nucleoside-diphosphate-sugar epimerase
VRILIIGGTRFIGPFLVRQLAEQGHHVIVYHRGDHAAAVPEGVEQIIAPAEAGPPSDRYHLGVFADRFRARQPDVVVHMIAFTRDDAMVFARVFKGVAGRAVVLSSSDVYRVMGRINRTEPGPAIPLPLNEDSPLREKLSIHGEDYEKRWVEQVVAAESSLRPTLLRFGAVYGPGDYRCQDWIKRMIDQRPAILIGKGEARFRFTHCYAQDAAWATTLATTNERSAGRTFNVGELNTPTQRQRLEDFARLGGYAGCIVEIPDEKRLPAGKEDFSQDWTLDTTRIRNELGFCEISKYEDGVRATIDWQRRHPNHQLDPSQFDYEAEDRLLAGMPA